MEEIGCHFKFENIIGNTYHDTNLLLSSGRNCLRYIIKEKGIKKLFLPYFLCETLTDVAKKENVDIYFYHIDENYMPKDIDESKLDEKSYIYYVNYYGLFRDKINDLIKQYKYIIIDNTHDFFDKDKYEADTIYNYRKYFGVPDGACIIGHNLEYNPSYERGKSLPKVIEMLSREETQEFFHYSTFLEADKHFRNEDLRYMSNFTENYLHAINYQDALEIRLNNYRLLRNYLCKYNRLDLSTKELTYMYPLLVSDGKELRSYLKDHNIYSLKHWVNVEWNGSDESEILRADNMVLLPMDQRYDSKDMEYIAENIEDYYRKQLVKK